MPVNHRHQLRRPPGRQRRRPVPRPGRRDARRARRSATPTGDGVGVGHLEGGRRRRSRGSPPACSRWASSPSSGSASPRAPATSGSSPTSRSCAPAARPRRSTRPPTPRTRRTSSATPSAASSSPRTTSRSPSSRSTRPSCRTCAQGRHLRRHHRRRLGDRPRRPRRARRRPTSPSTPASSTRPREAIAPDQLATLIYTSGTTGRPKGVRLRHRSWVYEGAAIQAQDILDEDDLQFLLAADGALVRQGAAVHPAGLRLRRPRSTAGSTRSSTTSAS